MSQRINELEFLANKFEQEIALGEQWEKLKSNPLFKKLVVENYLEKQAISLVHQFAHPSYDQQALEIQKSMVGIAELKQYIDMIGILAETAKSSLRAVKEELAISHSQESDFDGDDE